MDKAPLPVRHVVFRSINKPLCFCGVERRLFLFIIMGAACEFNMFDTLIGAILVFILLYILALWATNTDPKIVEILVRPLLNPSRARPLYDSAKLERSLIRLVKDL